MKRRPERAQNLSALPNNIILLRLFINRFKLVLHLAKRCKVPSPADKIVLAFQELAQLAQLTEWPGKQGQPWQALDSHCVCVMNGAAICPSCCTLLLVSDTCVCTQRGTYMCAYMPTTGRHTESPSWKRQRKCRMKQEFLIWLSLFAVKDFVRPSMRKTY